MLCYGAATPGTSFPPFLVSLACSCPYAEIIAVTWQSKNTPTGPVRVRSHRQVQKVPLLQFTNLQFHCNQVPALSLPASRLLFSHAFSLKALTLFLGTGSSAASIVAFTRFPPTSTRTSQNGHSLHHHALQPCRFRQHHVAD